MLKIVIMIDAPAGADPQGIKEKLAMDLECYGDVHVVNVSEVLPEQLRMGG